MAVDTLARAMAAGKVPISAYDLAVEAGYTGTEEEFAEDMGNSAANSNAAAQSAEDAAASAASIEASAEQIATNAENITALQSAMDDKANIDGYYEEMTVGTAEDFVTDLGITSQAPYSIRKAGGSLPIGGGRADLKQIVGLSLPWNQMINNRGTTSNGIVYTFDVTTGIVSYSGTADVQVSTYISDIPITPGHVYFVSYTNATGNDSNVFIRAYTGSSHSTVTKNSIYANATADRFNIALRTMTLGQSYSGSFMFMVHDLTIMFGKNIADYISGLSTAAAKIAWLRRYLPNLGRVYYPYTPIGSPMRHVNLSATKRTGFNLYKHGTTNGTAQVLGGVVHQITGAFTTLAYSNGTAITPDEDGYFTPAYDDVLTVTGGNATTTCIHIADEARDGDYEPYEEHTYALDSSVTLRGVPTRDGDNLVALGDAYTPDGTVTRKFSTKTFNGSTADGSWVAEGGSGNKMYFRIYLGAFGSVVDDTAISNLFTEESTISSSNTTVGFRVFNSSGGGNARLLVRPEGTGTTITDAASFKTWLASHPLTVVWERSETAETTEEADPYTEIQICEPGGIEQFVPVDTTEPQVPVGNITLYQQSLKAKLEAAPELPQSDGDYHLHMSGGVATYAADEAELPSDPSEDGEYVLTDTVADGTATKSWSNKLYGMVDDLDEDTSGYYAGVDLTQKFADEISASPYSGDAWAWIQARIQAGNFKGIRIGDYIPFTANSNTYNAQVAGINTYKGYGDTDHIVGNHIDFVCSKLWNSRPSYNMVNYNNGLIPVANVDVDGTSTSYVLAKKMDEVSSVTQDDVALTGWTYDPATFTLSFETAPSAGTIVVTGSGTEHPWLASNAYLYANSKSGQVPNGTGLNPAVDHKDYTTDGVYYYLPNALKAVIVEKRAYLPKRYNSTELLSSDNSDGWADVGKLWIPSEYEVFGCTVFGGNKFSIIGNIQYPIFATMENRIKQRGGTSTATGWWLLTSQDGNTTGMCLVSSRGNQNYTNAGASSSWGIPICFRIA